LVAGGRCFGKRSVSRKPPCWKLGRRMYGRKDLKEKDRSTTVRNSRSRLYEYYRETIYYYIWYQPRFLIVVPCFLSLFLSMEIPPPPWYGMVWSNLLLSLLIFAKARTTTTTLSSPHEGQQQTNPLVMLAGPILPSACCRTEQYSTEWAGLGWAGLGLSLLFLWVSPPRLVREGG
jgi:hypothetical protein